MIAPRQFRRQRGCGAEHQRDQQPVGARERRQASAEPRRQPPAPDRSQDRPGDDQGKGTEAIGGAAPVAGVMAAEKRQQPGGDGVIPPPPQRPGQVGRQRHKQGAQGDEDRLHAAPAVDQQAQRGQPGVERRPVEVARSRQTGRVVQVVPDHLVGQAVSGNQALGGVLVIRRIEVTRPGHWPGERQPHDQRQSVQPGVDARLGTAPPPGQESTPPHDAQPTSARPSRRVGAEGPA